MSLCGLPGTHCGVGVSARWRYRSRWRPDPLSTRRHHNPRGLPGYARPPGARSPRPHLATVVPVVPRAALVASARAEAPTEAGTALVARRAGHRGASRKEGGGQPRGPKKVHPLARAAPRHQRELPRASPSQRSALGTLRESTHAKPRRRICRTAHGPSRGSLPTCHLPPAARRRAATRAAPRPAGADGRSTQRRLRAVGHARDARVLPRARSGTCSEVALVDR